MPPLRTINPALQCTAKAKNTGQRCMQPIVPGMTKCRYHGGKSLKGPDQPNWKHGRYSKYLPELVKARYETARRDPELLGLREEIALIDARLSQLLEKVNRGETEMLFPRIQEAFRQVMLGKSQHNEFLELQAFDKLKTLIEEGASESEAWGEIRQSIKLRAELSRGEIKRLETMQQMITATQAMSLLARVVTVIKDNVEDPTTVHKIAIAINGLLDYRASPTALTGGARYSE